VCVSSNLNTRVVRDLAEMRELLRRLADHGVPMALSTDGPEMLKSYLRDEIATVLRHDILSIEEVERSLAVARDASFVDRSPVPGGARLDLVDRADGASIAVEVEA
jgi:adenosine deaminase